ncbi:HpcH/HpaI aldolase/citrate lyase family protein [Streptomyces sp. NPDC048825]|uniref:HpcH/HpaI aldolase family protein n=1 Tax=Streptomyces sp. NPDC048825 TaxID=3365592 RepID=UPI00371CE07B
MTDPLSVPAASRIRDRILTEDRPVLGAWLTRPSPDLLAALSASALDYVGIDCQHGMACEAEAARMTATAQPTAAGRLVRVSANRPELIGRVLDGGADGVIVPTVNSAEEARAAVAAVRFPPHGHRSYGPIAPHLPRDPEHLAQHALLLAMIETSQGLESVEDILAVPGVDGVYVGPADLGISLSLGPAQFPASPELEPALHAVVDAGKAARKIVGIHAGSDLFAERYADMGFRLLTLGTETSFVTAGVECVLERAGTAATNERKTSGPYSGT